MHRQWPCHLPLVRFAGVAQHKYIYVYTGLVWPPFIYRIVDATSLTVPDRIMSGLADGTAGHRPVTRTIIHGGSAPSGCNCYRDPPRALYTLRTYVRYTRLRDVLW